MALAARLLARFGSRWLVRVGLVGYCLTGPLVGLSASPVTFFAAFLLIDFAASALAFTLERKHPASKGDAWLLFHIWIQRFTYRQVFSVVLFKTLKRAIDGKPFNWDKLERTAKMSKATEEIMQ